MIPSADIGSLAKEMAGRSTGSRPPYVLFLGQGCARAAGVPSIPQLARSIFADLWDKDPEFAGLYLKAEDREHEDRLVAAFYEMFSRMSGLERYSVLQTYYGAIPVPSSYLDLARLIKAGYFTTILTTNIDTLLDKALNGVGLWPDTSYRVITPGEDMQHEQALVEASGDAAIRMIKLHGDVAQGVVTITPEEIEATLWPRRREVQGELTGDIIVVGYEFESEPINHLLMRYPAHELWWVSPEPPSQPLPIDPSRMITGESGSPSEFFSQLSLRLLRTTAPNLSKQASLDRPMPGVEEVSSTRSLPPRGSPDDDYSEIYLEAAPSPGTLDVDYDYDYPETAYLQDRIRRYQMELSSQELAALRGEVNAQREAQIRYLREQIARSEDEFREAERRNTPFGDQPRLLDLLDRLSMSAAWRPDDERAKLYLLFQIDTVRNLYNSEQPSQDTVSAAIGAIYLLAERLSPEVVSPQLVRALAVYAPSIGRRGV